MVSLARVCLVDFQGFQSLPRQLPEVLFPSSIPVTRERAMHTHRVAFKDSLERLFGTAVCTHISSCLSSSGACPALLSLPLPQSSAPDVQALFDGVAGSFHSGSAGTVCRPQKSIGTRVEGPLQATPLRDSALWPFPSRGSSNPLLACLFRGGPCPDPCPSIAAAQLPFYSEDGCKLSNNMGSFNPGSEAALRARYFKYEDFFTLRFLLQKVLDFEFSRSVLLSSQIQAV